MDVARLRYFGGTTNHWGGMCRPFEEEDFNREYLDQAFKWPINNQEINDEKSQYIKSRIRKNCSPKHVPAIIIKVPEIPRTKSGKIVELAVKQIINGEKINNKEAIANPEALKFFEKLPQLKL